MNKYILAILIGCASTAAHAKDDLRFVSCPIYRNTDSGKKSGCWLTDDHEDGQRYDVSLSPAKPDWNFAVLVEGKLSSQSAGACGAAVLDPVRVSVLHDQPCTRKMLPAEGFAGHPFSLPTRNMRPLYEKRTSFPTPYTTRIFAIPFDFNSSFLIYQLADYYIDQAVAYALASDAKSINITGWAVSRPQKISGQILRENPAIARDRADLVRQWMVGLGVPASRLHLEWKQDPSPSDMAGADGLSAPSQRRADIEIIPGRLAP